MANHRRLLLVIAALVLALGLVGGAVAVSCRGGDATSFPAPDSPVGSPVLPDLVPSPQLNVQTQQADGRWIMRFDTILTNQGEGAFVLRGSREPGRTWELEQDVQYSESGAEPVPVDSGLVWGGDGHEHWHVVRVASVWLVRLDENGKPVDNSKNLIDTKVGFCFYDHTHELDRGPEEPVYTAHTCGDEDDTELGMGLSSGWNDTYLMSLPGQSIDVTGLPDGMYRLWTEVDEKGAFREVTRDNNRTWIDLEFTMTPDGLRAIVRDTGPSPS
jgi:hypothetical protein